jgi:hypothetical protein
MKVKKERKVEVFTHINKEKNKKFRNKNKNI